MSSLTIALLALVGVCLFAVVYTYALYPLLIAALSRGFGRPARRQPVPEADLPTVTLLIAAYNEESEIGQRIENALAVDYPADRFEVVIASDGSSDRTVEIASRFRDPRVRVLAYPHRRGKTTVLNETLANHVRSEVVVLSDANTVNAPDSIRRLAEWFRDPSIGVVCGRLVLTDPATGRNVDSLYWKYETFLKKCESRLGALLGSNGGIYAIRRAAFTRMPSNTLVDDFVLPLLIRQKSGCRIVYDKDAVACEETPAAMTSEFHRRARIGAGGFQSIGILKGLLHPRHGWVAFTFLSHKVLRWACPLLLLAALAGSVALAALDPSYLWLLGAQVAFYAASAASGRVPERPRFLRVLRLPAMFTMMNAALFVGFLRWVRGPGNGTWRRTARADAAPRVQPSLAETQLVVSALNATATHAPLDAKAPHGSVATLG
jgi:cellulose synthase/poly-beta-1,6-N-acetylglucosamine synthase-like glycosyltransferase